MNYPLHLILFLFLFGVPDNLFAQTPYLQQIADQGGLPGMTVYGIIQGHDGYLWLGTEAGICRFDSQHFETFQVPTAPENPFSDLPKDSHQMKTDDIECLLFDSTSQTLYVENNGLFFYGITSKQKNGQVFAGAPKNLAIYQNKYVVVAAGHSARLLLLRGDKQRYTLPPIYLKHYPTRPARRSDIKSKKK